MNMNKIKCELREFYLQTDGEYSRKFAAKCFEILDKKVNKNMTVTEQKLLQYDVICEEFEPIIFKSVPFFFETGVLTSTSDGSRWSRDGDFIQANGWVYNRNFYKFHEQTDDLMKKRNIQVRELLYLICGPFNDTAQHFGFNNRPILECGLRGVYEKAKSELKKVNNPEEIEFLNAVCSGMITLKKMAEKFADKAERLISTESDEEIINNLKLVSKTAKRVPWEKPENLYEALAMLAFMRKALGSLESIGPNTFGRLDVDLYSFYKTDIERGTLTFESAYELISCFLAIWDCHYDHDMKMVGYADHELENSYTVGGCDKDGKPVFNDLTKIFLKATRDRKFIYPKITCRYSVDSPKEYLDEINMAVINGTSSVLYENDDAVIPALLRAGRTVDEARDYIVSGCWDIVTYQEKHDCGNYVNLLKPFEFAIHNLQEKMDEVGIRFEMYDHCTSFEEVYNITLGNCEKLLKERIDITEKGGRILPNVDRCPIFSSTLEGCIENKKDYSMNGAKYRDDYYYFFGFPDIIDSLIVIKNLVFDEKTCTLEELLTAVRLNWNGYDEIRMKAIRCNGWGDGSKVSCLLAQRFNNDLFEICQKYKGSYGGKIHMGYLTYTEIRFWGERTLATPNGRKNGEYFAQGLTPSRLKRIKNVGDVINSMSCIDKSTMAANSVINIILPGNISLDNCEAFLRSAAKTSVQALQLNCTTKDELLDAQKHPEKYPDLIVRVCGFSAKFTSLSKEWQEEVITRNFYE